MIQNNLSVLPFYTRLQEQNHNKPWAFGAIYPLIAPATTLLPFQITRERRRNEVHNTIALETSNVYESCYINSEGLVVEAETGFAVSVFNVSGLAAVYTDGLSNANKAYEGALLMVAKDADDNILDTLYSAESYYVGYWVLPENTSYIVVQTKATGTAGSVYGAPDYLYPIRRVLLHDTSGNRVANLTDSMLSAGLQVIPEDYHGKDIILFPANTQIKSKLREGRYYLSMTDGVETWYSDIITVVQDASQYVKIEWYDNEDLVFDAGCILYRKGYKNTLYVCSDIGKPSYGYTEEGKERDGYFFAEKQLSEKTYNFVFVAPEFVCDAVRLARLSDNIFITSNRISCRCDSFLAEYDWLEQGDLAAVQVEFKNGTVVKKIATALK